MRDLLRRANVCPGLRVGIAGGGQREGRSDAPGPRRLARGFLVPLRFAGSSVLVGGMRRVRCAWDAQPIWEDPRSLRRFRELCYPPRNCR